MEKDQQNVQAIGPAVPALAALGCLATGCVGLWYAYQHADVLGIFAAALSFSAVMLVGTRK